MTPATIEKLRALVLRYPSDADVRGVYADVLIDAGDPRGDFIRAQASLEDRLPPDAREAAQRQVQSLLAAHEKEWRAVASWADVRFKGGFIHAIRATIGSFLAHAHELFAVEPVSTVVLGGVSDDALVKLAEHEALARVNRLHLSGTFGDRGASALAKSRYVRSLRGLNLIASEIGEGFVSAAGNFESLVSLSLTGHEMGDELIAVLSKNELPKLERLYAARTALSDEGVAAIADAKTWTSLRWLCLGGNEISDEGADTLAKAKFGNVTHLELNQTSIGDEGALAIVKGKAFRALKKIDLRQTEVSSATIQQLRARKGLTVVGYAW
jgi:uncharacterized protein (TIGR02996 family)